MKSTLSLALAALVATLLITFSCQKSSHGEPDPNDPNNPNTPAIEYVTAGVSGRVVDDQNQPVNAAVVKVGTATATTDIDGNFTINNVRLNKNAGLVKVEKDGFFLGSRTIVVNTGVLNNVTIQLITKKVAGTVNNSGGNVTVPSGGTIAFTGNSFTNTGNNSAYTGTVSVSAFFINPEASNFKDIMPGALRGVRTTNEETGLQSFGMMAVELNGAGGEKLQLAAGKTATLTFPIPAGLLSQAPPTIPLWSFNDSSGLWKEEGTATKQGNNYVGTVSHFSFWNCDFPFGVVDFKAIIKDQNGKPFYPGQVTLRVKSDSLTSYGYGNTDSTGWVGGKVPLNKTLVMYVYNKCNIPLYTKEIGPFTANVDLGIVTVNNSGSTAVNLSGNAINCNATPVSNGFVDVFIDNMHYRATTKSDGTFAINFTRCIGTPTTAVLTAYDLSNNQSGTPTNVSVTSGNVNAGLLTACGTSIAEFANYTMNGVSYNFSNPADSVTLSKAVNSYTLYATRIGNSKDLSIINFAATGTGSATLIDVAVKASNKYWYLTNFATVNITEFGPVGTGFVAGNFSTKMTDSISTTQITYTFRARRYQ
ncbi:MULTISPECIES: carboxypeptidase regulatory-like domain-containing protein [Niastella]|uniref:Carboxypeptidase regulatory-like domain-containing protein n=1 Tax=Niastella soli TaxID=2821487 RepID=A0ABS3Z195_9BACT|nr:carboxypeptidase regulatory-like domain-containing protein [Niastella soli]MBO9203532.1 carboxypeptidase regulatory-like domain-containing protein [Niastella soli]